MAIIPVVFAGGNAGAWHIRSISTVVGEPLPTAERLAVIEGATTSAPARATWTLHGVVGHERYVERREHDELAHCSPPLGRAQATTAALIPVRKSEAWWALSQDERRAILAERSRHIAIGLKYLPSIARRLHHSRDLGEPFDFLTWFEFDPVDQAGSDELVGMLRATEEWSFVEREVDIRVDRDV
jgi:chlorite dismutase